MREVEKAYVAGFLDGDGSVMAIIEPHKEMKLGYRVRVVVKFSQARQSKPLLEELQQIVGCGYLSHSRNAVEYVIKGREEAKYFLEDIQPYIRGKRQQVDRALALLNSPRPNDKGELMKQARIADDIAAANIKSRSRRRMTSRNLLSPLLPL